MSKKTFSILMPIEFFAALIAAALLFSDVGAVIYLIAAVVFALVLTPFWLRLKKETDEEKKRKIRRNMALVMLLPIAAGVIAVVMVVVALMIYFAG